MNKSFSKLALTGFLVSGHAALAQDVPVWELQTSEALKAEAVAAAQADTADVTETVAVPADKKIGLILLGGQSASSFRIQGPIEQITAKLGWETIICDPAFDAQKMSQCATSMVVQGADAIFSISISPGVLGSGLRDANDRGVPWFGTVSGVEDTDLIIPYGSPGYATAQLSAEWLFSKAKARHGDEAKLKFMIMTAPTVGLANLIEEQEVLKAADADPNVEIVINHNLDLSNIVQDTINVSRRSVQQYPDLTGIWTVCDLCIPLMSQAMDTDDRTGDNRPILAGDYTTEQTVKLIREGKVDGVMDLPLEASVWVAFDQMLANWTRGTEIASGFDVFEKGYGLTFMEPYILEQGNVGDSGAIPVYGPDYVTYFETKWAAEYGL